jgi:hypothetical protein
MSAVSCSVAGRGALNDTLVAATTNVVLLYCTPSVPKCLSLKKLYFPHRHVFQITNIKGRSSTLQTAVASAEYWLQRTHQVRRELHRAARLRTTDCLRLPARSTPLARMMRNGDETRHRWQVQYVRPASGAIKSKRSGRRADAPLKAHRR